MPIFYLTGAQASVLSGRLPQRSTQGEDLLTSFGGRGEPRDLGRIRRAIDVVRLDDNRWGGTSFGGHERFTIVRDHETNTFTIE